MLTSSLLMGVRRLWPGSGTQSSRASGLYSTKFPYPAKRRPSSRTRQMPRNQSTPRQKLLFLLIVYFSKERYLRFVPRRVWPVSAQTPPQRFDLDEGRLGRDASVFAKFLLDPGIGFLESLAQEDFWFPTQRAEQAAVVAVASANALRAGEVVALADFLAGSLRNQIHQLIDGDQFVGAEVEGVVVIRRHHADHAFDAIVHVHEGARLLAVTPDFDLAAVGLESDLAAHCGGSFFFSAVIGAKRPIDVVEAHNVGLKLVVVLIVAAQLLGIELFPSVARFGLGGNGVFFLQRSYVRIRLFAVRVNASRR